MNFKRLLFLLILSVCILNAFGQTADEIIDKYIQAIGGKDAWTKINTLKQEAILDVNGTQIKLTFVAEQNKGYKQTVSLAGMSGYTIFTPQNGWNYYPWQGHQKPEAITTEEVNEGQDNLDIQGPLINYKEKGHSIEYEGKDDFEGTECYKIKFTEKSGKIITYYIDPSNYFIIHSVTLSKANGQESESTTDYSNYKKLPEGVWMPMNIGTPGNTLKVVKTEVNPAIDDNQFKTSTN